MQDLIQEVLDTINNIEQVNNAAHEYALKLTGELSEADEYSDRYYELRPLFVVKIMNLATAALCGE